MTERKLRETMSQVVRDSTPMSVVRTRGIEKGLLAIAAAITLMCLFILPFILLACQALCYSVNVHLWAKEKIEQMERKQAPHP
jgi:hypothetical protein